MAAAVAAAGSAVAVAAGAAVVVAGAAVVVVAPTERRTYHCKKITLPCARLPNAEPGNKKP